jgi:hypothetical protein
VPDPKKAEHRSKLRAELFNGFIMSEITPHWSSDPFWIDALEKYQSLREGGLTAINIDLELLEEGISSHDSPAFKLVDAMCSVREHEGWDGHKGAPRLVLALLVLLREQC